MIRSLLIIYVFALAGELTAQEKKDTVQEYPYDRKEEIIYQNKRYRLHNNYLTLGAGAAASSLRNTSQKILAADFQFHIRKHHFQAGASMSGSDYLANNHIQGHLCYGFRRERNTSNLAVFAGPAYYSGVTGNTSTQPVFYDGIAIYACAQAVYKIAYDIGLGIEFFNEYSSHQNLFGFKIIAFFSGAYMGVKRNYNPHVRSENQ